MTNLKNLSIWKPENLKENKNESYLQMNISDLGLSVRAYNCLRRANCNTVEDILNCIEEDDLGLKKIRNLGRRSEAEIFEKLQDIREATPETNPAAVSSNPTRLLKPSVRIWDKGIDEFALSEASRNRFESCGIKKLSDLYKNNSTSDPGWHAVRELFSKIPIYR